MKTTLVKKKTIILADNSPSITSLFKFVLSQNNYNVITLPSKQLFLSFIKKNKDIDKDINLILLDLALLETTTGNAKETLCKLQKKHPTLKIIILAGDKLNTIIDNTILLNTHGIIFKPFDIEDVLKIIKEVTEN
tara:strand:+ start:1084 stop:1488 length:405 start_codon:yes stop_codon:yes gene_type:complete